MFGKQVQHRESDIRVGTYNEVLTDILLQMVKFIFFIYLF